ncbi:MAG: hypothetical protein R3B13_17800 [Polyangiaceae bacterium]
MRVRGWVAACAFAGALAACSSSKSNNGGSGGTGAGGGGGVGNVGGGGGVGNVGAGGNAGGGGSPSTANGSCFDILGCIANCPDGDDACLDTCFAGGSSTGQQQLLALLTCMDQKQCTEVSCIETQCTNELATCLDSSTVGGNPNPGGTVPTGSIPTELVGHWVRPGSTDIADFTFGADGSAQRTQYKESSIGSCDMSIDTKWLQGSVVASGNQLTVTLADGVTTVAWIGGCGSNYQNPAAGKVLQYQYRLDASGLWLTELSCTGELCEVLYQKN